MDGQEFQMRCWTVMESNLTTQEKIFMIAKFLYEGNPQRVTHATGLTPQIAKHIEVSLVQKNWLVFND